MSGVFTPGLPAPSTTNVALPIGSAGFNIPADTNAASGGAPESVAINTNGGLLASLGNSQAGVISGSTLTLDASLGSLFSLSLSGSAYAMRVINMSPGQLLEVYLGQSSTGSTISTYKTGFGASTASDTAVVWAAKTAPTLSTSNPSYDVLTFRYNATTTQARGGSVLNIG